MSNNAIKKEVRFAVVMYGGGSLAIYINGIAQELLKMVRSTAKNRQTNEKFGGTERVYRQLALLLSDERLLNTVSALNQPEKIAAALDSLLIAKRYGKSPKAMSLYEKHLKKPTVRFVIDVITGSSAGGINGIFLAKALVNNQPIDRLKKLWLEEGDFDKLLNDKRSVADISQLKRPSDPASLLNSQRMYLKLLDALDEMDKTAAKESATHWANEDLLNSPNVEELDLFVTVTDFAGVPVPIRLFDGVVNERRHRQFFHFRYSKTTGSHFLRRYNPFLAFAARSTSAFPLAFEPSCLSDIDEVIERRFADIYSGNKSDSDVWREFFHNFKLPKNGNASGEAEKAANCARYFVDGGALDNKPFGFAIDALLKRQANVPVERKLIYIEPTPEILQPGEQPKKPDALENLFGQASGLPRYETIREDLQQLLERNRFVERVNRLIQYAERDIYELLSDNRIDSAAKNIGNAASGDSGADWEQRGLNEIIAFKGAAFLPYYRLRLIAATDDIARLVARFYGFDEDSDYFLAVRSIVRFWREDTFAENSGERTKTGEPKHTVNYFLRHYDLNYRLRRIRFTKRKAENLYNFYNDVRDQLKFRYDKIQSAREVFNKLRGTSGFPESDLINGKFPGEIIWEKCRNSGANIAQMREMSEYCQIRINRIFQELHNKSEVLSNLRVGSEPLSMSGGDRPLFGDLLQKLTAVALAPADLHYILGGDQAGKKNVKNKFDQEAARQRAKHLLTSKKNGAPGKYENLQTAGAALDNYFEAEFFSPGREKMAALLGEPTNNPATAEQIQTKLLAEYRTYLKGKDFDQDLFLAIIAFLRHYYENFDDYDQISFPIFFNTPVGEAETVEVVRISPHDAPSLINELDEKEKRRKLAGNALYGFGAFLDARWRQNDIAWGRLDGAERIITALLPTYDKYDCLRSVLIKKAHEAIFEEEFVCRHRDALNEQIVAALLNAKAYGEANNFEQTVEKITSKLIAESVLKSNLSDVFKNCLTDSASLYQAVQKGYQIDRSLEPRDALRLASRATQISGKILEQAAEKNALAGNRLAWIARLGAIFWSLVEVAAPHTVLNLLFRYWLKLLYFFEAFLIIGGTLLIKPDIQNFGVVSFLVTLALHLTTAYLNDLMRGGIWRRTMFFILFVAGILFFLLGILLFLALFFDRYWQAIIALRRFFATSGGDVLPGVLLGALILLALAWGAIKQYRNQRKFERKARQ